MIINLLLVPFWAAMLNVTNFEGYLLSLALFILYLKIQDASCIVEISNVQYKSVDKDFADFQYCYIKSINRTYKYLSLRVNLFKVPIDNISVSIEVKKKANGYKPWLFNVTFDGCKFLKEQKSNPVANYFYGFIKDHSNINHTCPINHDFIVEKADLSLINNRITNILPFPEGEYAAYTKWFAYNKVRAYVNVFIGLR